MGFRKGDPLAAAAARKMWADRKRAAPAAAAPASSSSSSNVIPFAPRGQTLGEALQALRSSSPSVTGVPTPGGHSAPAILPAAPAGGEVSKPGLSVELAPPPSKNSGNMLFSKMAASCCTTVGVVGFTKLIELEGLEAREPADDEIEVCQEHTAEAIARGIGDRELPWWAPLILAYGQLYAGMRVGAKKLGRTVRPEIRPTGAPSSAPAAAPSPPPLPPPQAAPPPPAWAKPAPPSPVEPARARGGSIPMGPLPPIEMTES